MSPLYIVIGILVLVVFILVVLYNGLVSSRMHVKEAWADIDVQLKRRLDLIPNLINTVKGSTNFESSTLEKVIQARSASMQAKTPTEIGAADKQVTGALTGFFALAESYPDLKSSQNFISLQNELSDTENKLQSARRFYNGVVMEYNTKTQTIPTSIFANMFGFTEADFFELSEKDEVAREPVQVSF